MNEPQPPPLPYIRYDAIRSLLLLLVPRNYKQNKPQGRRELTGGEDGVGEVPLQLLLALLLLELREGREPPQGSQGRGETPWGRGGGAGSMAPPGVHVRRGHGRGGEVDPAGQGVLLGALEERRGTKGQRDLSESETETLPLRVRQRQQERLTGAAHRNSSQEQRTHQCLDCTHFINSAINSQ